MQITVPVLVVTISVADPDKLNLDLDPAFFLNPDTDPDLNPDL